MTRRVTLPPRARGEVSAILLKKKKAGKWTYESLAEAATAALLERSEAPGITEDERELWESLEVSVDQIRTLMDCPANPTGDLVRRAALLGVCLALDVDLAAMNRVAGGIG